MSGGDEKEKTIKELVDETNNLNIENESEGTEESGNSETINQNPDSGNGEKPTKSPGKGNGKKSSKRDEPIAGPSGEGRPAPPPQVGAPGTSLVQPQLNYNPMYQTPGPNWSGMNAVSTPGYHFQPPNMNHVQSQLWNMAHAQANPGYQPSPIVSSSQVNSGGAQLIQSQLTINQTQDQTSDPKDRVYQTLAREMEANPWLNDPAAMAKVLEAGVKSFLSRPSPSPAVVRARDPYPLPGHSNAKVNTGVSNQNSIQNQSEVIPDANVDSVSQHGSEARFSRVTNGNLFANQSSTVTNDDVGLDVELSGVSGMIGPMISGIQTDFSSRLTKTGARGTARRIVRISRQQNTPASEFESLAEEISRQISILQVEGPSGPTNSWRLYYECLRLCEGQVTAKMWKAKASEAEERSFQHPARSSVDFAGSDSLIKTVPSWDGKDWNQYIDYFEVCTMGMPLESRKQLLVVKLGPEHLGRIRKIPECTSWQQCKDHLASELSEWIGTPELAISWKRLKQRNDEDLSKYNDRVKMLASRTEPDKDNTRNIERITSWIDGLSSFRLRNKFHSKLRNQDSSRPSRTLHQFMMMADSELRINKIAGTDEYNEGTDSVFFARPEHIGSQSESKKSILNPSAPCDRHDKVSHTNGECRTPVGICCYCKKPVDEAKFADGSHKRECTADRCSHCERRGHRSDGCRARDQGRERGRDRYSRKRRRSNSGGRDKSRRDRKTRDGKDRKRFKKDSVMVSEDKSDRSDSGSEATDSE